MTYQVICAFGDSITNGYWDEQGKGGWFGRLSALALSANAYQLGFNNLAMDGDYSFSVLHRLQSEGFARDIGIILIAVGVNDLIRWHRPDAPLEMGEELRREIWNKILSTAKRLAPRVLVLPVLPVDESRFPQEGAGGRLLYHHNTDVAAYNTLIAALCAQHNVPFADYTSALAACNWSGMLYDASHPSAAGHQLLAELAYAELRKLGWCA